MSVGAVSEEQIDLSTVFNAPACSVPRDCGVRGAASGLPYLAIRGATIEFDLAE